MQIVARSLIFLALMSLALATDAAERTTYFIPDAQGSPVAAMDEQGNVLWRESYAPYGERRIKSPENNARPAYTGKPEDTGTGLVYLGARWYDPSTARFTGIDPQGFTAGNPQSFGRYLYANSNPYKYVDPDGEVPVLIPVAVTAVKEGAGMVFEAATGLPAVFSVKGLTKAVRSANSDVARTTAEKSAGSSRIVWPPNRGLEGESAKASLIPGAKVDRYGSEEGSFVAPAGTPFPQRSLPAGYEKKQLHEYEVLKPIDADAGTTAAWFGQPGGGTQFELPGSVRELIDSKHLKRVE